MSKYFIPTLMVLFLLSGCKEVKTTDSDSLQHANIGFVTTGDSKTEKVSIDTDKSLIKWKGTKLLGTGKHEGTVKFSEGWLNISEEKIEGGYFEVDMQSIFVTDIPLSQRKAHRNLTNHLKSDFETKLFSKASFTITGAEIIDAGTLNLTGDMNIKGITNAITIRVTEIELQKAYISEITLDRFNWKIGENGSWLEKRLVDAEFFLEVEIHLGY